MVGVVLGGSRAAGTTDDHSDWDVGVYYHGGLDHDRLSAFGEVHPAQREGLIDRAGLRAVNERITAVSSDPADLTACVDDVRARLTA